MREELCRALEAQADDVAVAVSDGDRDRLLRLWAELSATRRELDLLAREVEAAAVEQFDRGEEVVVDGLGVAAVTRKAARTRWDHHATAKRVVAAALEADQIGHPLDVVNLLLDVGSMSYWRVQRLRALGIDPDEEDLREVTGGTLGLRWLA